MKKSEWHVLRYREGWIDGYYSTGMRKSERAYVDGYTDGQARARDTQPQGAAA